MICCSWAFACARPASPVGESRIWRAHSHAAVEHLGMFDEQVFECHIRALSERIFLPTHIGGHLGVQFLVREHQFREHLAVILALLFHLGLDLGDPGFDLFRVHGNLLGRQVLVDQDIVDEVVEDFRPGLRVLRRGHAC